MLPSFLFIVEIVISWGYVVSKGKLNLVTVDDSNKSKLNSKYSSTNIVTLDSVEEGNYVRKSKKKKAKKGFFTVSRLLLVLFVCALLAGAKLGGMFNYKDATSTESSVIVGSVWGTYFAKNVPMDNTVAFESAIKKYFKSEYGLSITVSDIKDNVSDGVSSLEATVRVLDDANKYTFVYSKEGKKVDISEDYGSRYTSRLVSERLSELYKNKLPKNSEIWVVTDSLSAKGDIDFSSIEEVVSEWDIADIVSYNKANHLIKEINISILSGGESNLSKYAKRLVDVVTTLDASRSGIPKLNVGFFKGKNSRNYVYEDIASRRGIDVEDIDFSIDWYEEIPKIAKVKNYMWGAISISENAGTVLNAYVDDKVDFYTVEGGSEEIPIYKRVKDLID